MKAANCDEQDKEEPLCRTEYETVCETTQAKHDVSRSLVGTIGNILGSNKWSEA